MVPVVPDPAQEQRPGRKTGVDSDSDFESDPPSPKSSEDSEAEEEEALNSEHGEDTEPDHLGQRPLLMDSEEEEHSSDSDPDPSRVRSRSKKPGGRKEPAPRRGPVTPPSSPSGAGPPGDVDVFGAVPFLGGASPVGPSETADIFSKAPFSQGGVERTPTADFDVFSKAPFGRNLSRCGGDAPLGPTPPLSPEGVDVFGFSPFHPGSAGPPTASRSADSLSRPEEPTNQQQRLKQRSLQRLSSRQRKTRPEAAVGGGKRHHGTPTGARKTGKPTYRTPERVRRHKKAGRRDSQSSNEFLSPSDSKENISVDPPLPLPPDDPILDPFGAKPFHPQNGGESRTMDDFGAVPFTELVVHSGPQQPPDLDPFGAAPFPSKQ